MRISVIAVSGLLLLPVSGAFAKGITDLQLIELTQKRASDRLAGTASIASALSASKELHALHFAHHDIRRRLA